MKKIFMAMAVVLLSATMFTSCKSKNDPKNAIIGEWVNEATVQNYQSVNVLRKIVYTFTETGVNYAGYYDGTLSCGNSGTYTMDASNVTISFTVPTCTETGTLIDGVLTINTKDFGTLQFTKK